jgi:hypothetical protein
VPVVPVVPAVAGGVVVEEALPIVAFARTKLSAVVLAAAPAVVAEFSCRQPVTVIGLSFEL